ncbi:unnamed protein product [Pedinophyceae sp. YPF-701]|nr:unnamed protein product [Pedinophyceae sp. YPF-701]
MSPPWRVMLLSDGSVTRHLQILSGLDIEVDCLSMRRLSDAELAEAHDRLPDVSLIDGPVVERQVVLRRTCRSKQALVYAASWWNADKVDTYLRDRSKPIWASLSEERLELHRQLCEVRYGRSPELEAAELLGHPGPFWARHYVFYHDGAPLTVIYEVFSTALADYLGPVFAGDGRGGGGGV